MVSFDDNSAVFEEGPEAENEPLRMDFPRVIDEMRGETSAGNSSKDPTA